MPLGNPIRKQNESRMVSVLATEGQTVVTVQGGYIINHISVFRNGVRLSNAEDFTAGDGSTVTLNNAANIEDRIEFHVFDRFTVSGAIVSAASTQTISGDLVLTGKLFGELDVASINTGIATVTEADVNCNLNVSGVSTLSNVLIGSASTDFIVHGDARITGVITATRIHSELYGEFTGSTVAADSLVGTSLSVSGISTLGITSATDFVINYVLF